MVSTCMPSGACQSAVALGGSTYQVPLGMREAISMQSGGSTYQVPLAWLMREAISMQSVGSTYQVPLAWLPGAGAMRTCGEKERTAPW